MQRNALIPESLCGLCARDVKSFKIQAAGHMNRNKMHENIIHAVYIPWLKPRWQPVAGLPVGAEVAPHREALAGLGAGPVHGALKKPEQGPHRPHQPNGPTVCRVLMFMWGFGPLKERRSLSYHALWTIQSCSIEPVNSTGRRQS